MAERRVVRPLAQAEYSKRSSLKKDDEASMQKGESDAGQ